VAPSSIRVHNEDEDVDADRLLSLDGLSTALTALASAVEGRRSKSYEAWTHTSGRALSATADRLSVKEYTKGLSVLEC
jgi:hypothetical protein